MRFGRLLVVLSGRCACVVVSRFVCSLGCGASVWLVLCVFVSVCVLAVGLPVCLFEGFVCVIYGVGRLRICACRFACLVGAFVCHGVR